MKHSAWIVCLAMGCTFRLADLAETTRDTGVADTAATHSTTDAAVIEASCSPDLNTDRNHCGRCGHSCLGGGCAAGECLAVNLSVGIDSPGGIAIDDAHVFFTDTTSGNLYRANKDGTAPFIIGQFQTGALSLASFGSALAYSSRDNAMVGVINDTMAGGTKTVANMQTVSWGYLAIDDTYVYWPDPGAGTIMRGTRLMTPTVLTKLATDEKTPHSVLLDGDDLYWTTLTAGELVRAKRDGSGRTVIATGLIGPEHLARLGPNMYVTSTTAKSITRVPLGGGEPVLAFSDQNEVHGIIADGDTLWWATSSLMRYDGKALKAFHAGAAHRIAADATAVYWTEFAGSVKRKAK